jgi:hypothetical protein
MVSIAPPSIHDLQIYRHYRNENDSYYYQSSHYYLPERWQMNEAVRTGVAAYL